MPHFDPCDLLAIGPHPDDVEIGCGGTILLAVDRGLRAAVLDVTRGEMGSRGTAAERAQEAAEATVLLGLAARHNLALPDTKVAVTDAAVDLLVAALRAAQPKVLLAPHPADVHPDHTAVAELAGRAWFLAGLRNHRPDLGAPQRPRLFLRYPGNRAVAPSLCVDIQAVAARKDAVLRCYRSQLNPPDRGHLVAGFDVRERAEVRDRFYGAQIGCQSAEAFVVDGPLPVRDLAALFG
jgi:bacillithiol biosynthesis deacetylase BshB1